VTPGRWRTVGDQGRRGHLKRVRERRGNKAPGSLLTIRVRPRRGLQGAASLGLWRHLRNLHIVHVVHVVLVEPLTHRARNSERRAPSIPLRLEIAFGLAESNLGAKSGCSGPSRLGAWRRASTSSAYGSARRTLPRASRRFPGSRRASGNVPCKAGGHRLDPGCLHQPDCETRPSAGQVPELTAHRPRRQLPSRVKSQTCISGA
jgi:hypothetical protein